MRIHFHFIRIFDIRHKGYLDAFDLNFFFREIREQLRQRGEEMVTFEDVKDEIYDMVSGIGNSRYTKSFFALSSDLFSYIVNVCFVQDLNRSLTWYFNSDKYGQSILLDLILVGVHLICLFQNAQCGIVLSFHRRPFLAALTVKRPPAKLSILHISQVKPKGSDKTHIYLDDLIACNQGKTVVSILTDIHGFCAYENRERIAADQPQDDFE